MSRFWNNRTRNLSPYIPGEQPKDRQFIKLNTNENPYPPSPKVIEAIKKAADEHLRLYPDFACTELREAIADHYRVKTEQIFVGNGSDEILAFAFGAFFENDTNAQPILFPDITYSFYPVYANLWGIPYRTVPLFKDFSINCDDYKTSCGGVVFPNPNAPTGMAVLLDDILKLAKYIEEQERVLIVDEAYIAFSSTKGIIADIESAVPHINEHHNLLTVHTLSKSASLAGLRVGFAIGDEKLIEGLWRIRDSFNSYTIDHLALAGAKAAISDSAYYNDINCRVINTRERIAQDLRTLDFQVLPSSANFLFVKPPAGNGKEYFIALRERGILVRHFSKDRIADYLRVSIGTDEDMDKFIENCKEIISKT
jgi:histidinol-phosphate aminotransferase